MTTPDTDQQRLDDFARSLVRIASEVTWIGSRVDTMVDLDSLEGRVLTLLATRRLWVMSVLREVVGIDRTVMSKVTSRLESRGWLVKDGPADDRRHLVIRATDDGRTSWMRAESQRVALLAELCYRATEDERKAIELLQRRLEDVMRRYRLWGWGNPAFYRRARQRRAGFQHPALPDPDRS